MLLLYCASLHSQVHHFALQYHSLSKLTFTACLPLTTPIVPNLIKSKSERMNGLFFSLSPSSVPCTKRTLNTYWMNVTKFLLKCIIHQNNRSYVITIKKSNLYYYQRLIKTLICFLKNCKCGCFCNMSTVLFWAMDNFLFHCNILGDTDNESSLLILRDQATKRPAISWTELNNRFLHRQASTKVSKIYRKDRKKGGVAKSFTEVSIRICHILESKI